MTGPSKNGDNYHHGNLRNALIIAAAELIEERGSEDFAMNEAARKAGVSCAAPYRHFKDKDDLIIAVCRLSFYSLSERLTATVANNKRGTTQYITELGKCYIRFVREHPAFFDLMWSDRGSKALDEEFTQQQKLSTNGFWLLVDAVEAWCVAEKIKQSDPLDLPLKLWSMALGLGTLAINQHMQRFAPDADIEEMLESSTGAFLYGIKAQQC